MYFYCLYTTGVFRKKGVKLYAVNTDANILSLGVYVFRIARL